MHSPYLKEEVVPHVRGHYRRGPWFRSHWVRSHYRRSQGSKVLLVVGIAVLVLFVLYILSQAS